MAKAGEEWKRFARQGRYWKPGSRLSRKQKYVVRHVLPKTYLIAAGSLVAGVAVGWWLWKR